ncbi:MAG: hypothetical protein ACOYL6_03360 [Bacteriovoracaceae bacterium]
MKVNQHSLGLRFLDIVSIVPQNYRKICEYFIQLVPLVVISIIISYHRQSFLDQQVGNRPVFDLLLAGAVLAPWLAQACCMPLYIELGQEIYVNGKIRTASMLYHLIRKNLYAPLILTTLGGLLFRTFYPVPWMFTLSLILICFCQVLFSQFMVLPLTLKRFDIWLLSWGGYFLALAIFPQLWFLPPLSGIIVIILVAPKSTGEKAFKTSKRNYMFWLLCGLIVGLILWFDKVTFYLLQKEQTNPLYIFISLIPSLLALNYFYIFRLPQLEKVLTNTISSINNKSIQHYLEWKNYTYLLVKQTFFEILGLLVFFSCISCTMAIVAEKMDWKMVLLTHLLTLFMTIITVIFNTLLLLRAFSLFFKMAAALFFFFLLVVWRGQDQMIFFEHYLMAFCYIAFMFVLMARRKWKRPHLSYFSN